MTKQTNGLSQSVQLQAHWSISVSQELSLSQKVNSLVQEIGKLTIRERESAVLMSYMEK